MGYIYTWWFQYTAQGHRPNVIYSQSPYHLVYIWDYIASKADEAHIKRSNAWPQFTKQFMVQVSCTMEFMGLLYTLCSYSVQTLYTPVSHASTHMMVYDCMLWRMLTMVGERRIWSDMPRSWLWQRGGRLRSYLLMMWWRCMSVVYWSSWESNAHSLR